MGALEIARAKELRGDIIEQLYARCDEDLSLSTIRNMLRYKTYISESDIKKAASYLSGDKKEYIKIIRHEENYWDTTVQITPAGINLAEADIKDLGVLIDG